MVGSFRRSQPDQTDYSRWKNKYNIYREIIGSVLGIIQFCAIVHQY